MGRVGQTTAGIDLVLRARGLDEQIRGRSDDLTGAEAVLWMEDEDYGILGRGDLIVVPDVFSPRPQVGDVVLVGLMGPDRSVLLRAKIVVAKMDTVQGRLLTLAPDFELPELGAEGTVESEAGW